MFKSLLIYCLLLVPLQLFAADYSARGKNRIGQTIMLQEGANGLEINVYKNKYLKFNNKLFYSDHYYGDSEDEKPIKSYLFKTECPDWEWHTANPMSCSAAGESQLAKTQYIRWSPKGRKDSCGGQATFLRCVKGCDNKRVPKLLEELPYECE